MAKTTRTHSATKWTLLALVMFLLVAVIGGTYTRYTSTASGDATIDVAKWAVKINDEDITAQNTFTVASFKEVPNNYVVDGKIAPNTLLYADFEIDPTGSEVAIDYQFELGTITSNGSVALPNTIRVEDVRNISSSSVEATADHSEGTKVTETASGSRTYAGVIQLDPATGTQTNALTSSAKQTIRVYVRWEDLNTTAANGADTNVAIENVLVSGTNKAPTLTMTVTGTATQKVS